MAYIYLDSPVDPTQLLPGSHIACTQHGLKTFVHAVTVEDNEVVVPIAASGTNVVVRVGLEEFVSVNVCYEVEYTYTLTNPAIERQWIVQEACACVGQKAFVDKPSHFCSLLVYGKKMPLLVRDSRDAECTCNLV